MPKGSSYERELCRKLSLWWSEGQRDDLFWRTAGSGGRATVRGKKGLKTSGHCGDITNTDSVGEPFIKVVVVESKRGYSSHTIANLLDCPANSKQQVYEEWIEQAKRSQKNAGAKYWMLIHKRDRREPLVFIPDWFWQDISVRNMLASIEIAPKLELRFQLKSEKESGEETIVGMHLEDFLKITKPSYILSIKECGNGASSPCDRIESVPKE